MALVRRKDLRMGAVTTKNDTQENIRMKQTQNLRKSLTTAEEGRTEEENLHKERKSNEPTSLPTVDRFRQAKSLAAKAAKARKIFTIYGHYPVIRASLRKRGWVERTFPTFPAELTKASNGSNEVYDADGKLCDSREWTTTQLTRCNKTEKCKIQDNTNVLPEEDKEITYHFDPSDAIHDMMSAYVKNEIPSFIWTVRRDVIDYHTLRRDQMLNHYGRTGSFTTKIGLCLNLRNLSWYVEANPDSFFPRCYSLCSTTEREQFIDDFRHNAACSILKWVVTHGMSKTDDGNDTEDCKQKIENGTELIDMACNVWETYLGKLDHEDIDDDVDSASSLTETEWDELIQQYYLLIHDDAVIDDSGDHVERCENMLKKIKEINPQFEIEGLRNVWIIKPGAKSRGRDIVCMDKIEDILKLVTTDFFAKKDNKWVVQKYIEVPLLIYDTKFDIRQWFLVTEWNPLTVWFYKDSYLRFSTQPFSLKNLDSSIHLCNNSIQKHYKNCPDRNPLLPRHNMWGSAKFRNFLHNQGHSNVWENVIYPSMKKAIIYTMKMAQDNVESRKNSFELYGADFILGQDFKPWLIEINSSPTMYPSTPVTTNLCAQVQEDTIKVVVDREWDQCSSTGKFELLWRQPLVELPTFTGGGLLVAGSRIKEIRTITSTGEKRDDDKEQGTKCPLLNQDKSKENVKENPKLKQRLKTTKEKLPSNVTVLPKCLPRKNCKTKNSPLKPILKTGCSSLPNFLHYLPSVPKITHVSQMNKSTGYAQNSNRISTPVLNVHTLNWTVLQPSNSDPKISEDVELADIEQVEVYLSDTIQLTSSSAHLPRVELMSNRKTGTNYEKSRMFPQNACISVEKAVPNTVFMETTYNSTTYQPEQQPSDVLGNEMEIMRGKERVKSPENLILGRPEKRCVDNTELFVAIMSRYKQELHRADDQKHIPSENIVRLLERRRYQKSPSSGAIGAETFRALYTSYKSKETSILNIGAPGIRVGLRRRQRGHQDPSNNQSTPPAKINRRTF
ncbi:protein monoglycylase TTLL8 [Microcaecilia unicolor]|uniref:Protein monoglycylase TTLL8 n=1 Tax=Microcaecilia unicolor TaxID=1415580 RepID=A0A6P7Z7S1_9AMPH|nr:protein monoglycylase TTLL8 [Microcaecilia unicolor]